MAIALLPLEYQIRLSGPTIQPSPGVLKVHLNSSSKAAMPEKLNKPVTDNRVSRRAKIARPVRVRPSEPRDDHFEDIPISVNASKSGIKLPHSKPARNKKPAGAYCASGPMSALCCESLCTTHRARRMAVMRMVAMRPRVHGMKIKKIGGGVNRGFSGKFAGVRRQI